MSGVSHSLMMMIVLWCAVLPAGAAQAAAGRQVSSAMFIDLDNGREAPRLTSPENGVLFDIDADGTRDRVAWTAAGDNVAILAMDTDGDGRITSGKELFGSYTVPGAGNGANALLGLFDASGAPPSGALENGHELYERILLWTDGNHNGISEPGELRPARELFTRIGLGFVMGSSRDEHGNRAFLKGWVELRTGGPEQRAAVEPGDQQSRLRHYYEIALAVGRR